jgi:hypothetical protein
MANSDTPEAPTVLIMNISEVYEDGNELGRKCKLCPKVVETPNKGTSGLRQHALRKHSITIPLLRRRSNNVKRAGE